MKKLTSLLLSMLLVVNLAMPIFALEIAGEKVTNDEVVLVIEIPGAEPAAAVPAAEETAAPAPEAPVTEGAAPAAEASAAETPAAPASQTPAAETPAAPVPQAPEAQEPAAPAAEASAAETPAAPVPQATAVQEPAAPAAEASAAQEPAAPAAQNTQAPKKITWQYADSKDSETWIDVEIEADESNGTSSALTLNFETIKDTLGETFEPIGKWFRGVFGLGTEEEAASEAVQIRKFSSSEVSGSSGNSGVYVSNDSMAYRIDKDEGTFNILGKYSKETESETKEYWMGTSYNGFWQMYAPETEEKLEPMKGTNGASSSDQITDGQGIQNVQVTFGKTDGEGKHSDYSVNFDVKMKETAANLAVGADVMLGSTSTSGSYSDSAALDALVKNNIASSVQMIGAASADKAKETDPALNVNLLTKPTNCWIGGYNGRMYFADNYDRDGNMVTGVGGTDSGMTFSYQNAAGSSIKFSFGVGSVQDTGAETDKDVIESGGKEEEETIPAAPQPEKPAPVVQPIPVVEIMANGAVELTVDGAALNAKIWLSGEDLEPMDVLKVSAAQARELSDSVDERSIVGIYDLSLQSGKIQLKDNLLHFALDASLAGRVFTLVYYIDGERVEVQATVDANGILSFPYRQMSMVMLVINEQ